jgi:hypothetical protein
LSENTDGDFKVKAGDRMPYFSVAGEGIYDRLREPRFHLLTFFDGNNNPPDISENEFTELMDFHNLPLYPNVAEIFGAKKSFVVLLRPDNYVAFISGQISAARLEKYLTENLQ